MGLDHRGAMSAAFSASSAACNTHARSSKDCSSAKVSSTVALSPLEVILRAFGATRKGGGEKLRYAHGAKSGQSLKAF